MILETVETGHNPSTTSLPLSHRRVLGSAAMLAGTTILVKLVLFAKDWLVARQIGAGDELDAFLVAFLLPLYAIAVLGQSFASAFMPTYIRALEQQGPAAANRLVGGMLARGPLSLIAVTVLLSIASPFVLPWLGTGFDEQKLALTQSLFFILMGVLCAAGLSAICAAVLNAHEHFAFTAAAQLAMPLTTFAVFWGFQQRHGVYALAAGTLLGFALECTVLCFAMFRCGLLAKPTWNGTDENTRQVGRQFLPLVGGALLMSSSPLVDQSMAASLGSGQVSILNYGAKIVGFVVSLVAVSLSTVLFPKFSRWIAAGRSAELGRMINAYAWLVLLASVPIIVTLALFGEPLVRLLFQRGAFTPETTEAVSTVQFWLLPQIPFYILGMLGARILNALDANQIVLRLSALNLVMNVAGNYAFMHWFGVAGIAMSTSLVYFVSMIMIFAAIRFKLAEARLS